MHVHYGVNHLKVPVMIAIHIKDGMLQKEEAYFWPPHDKAGKLHWRKTAQDREAS